jgi:hypothetical protein
MAEFLTRFQNAWNVFLGRSPTKTNPSPISSWYGGYSYRPDRNRLTFGNERSIVSSIYNRIAIDVAGVVIRHVRVDENGQFIETLDTPLNKCLTLDANLDQTGRALIQDLVLSMFDEGCVAVVPVATEGNPYETNSYKIYSMRVGKIVEWFPHQVKVELYNEDTGQKKQLILDKATISIIENPLYAVINEPNSILKRLIRKLNLLDAIDEQSSAGKLDLIIQLPYTIRSDKRKEQAEQRRADIEQQLSGSKYGIAYADATEHITQLNRPVENNLMNQIQYLTSMLYGQLGLTEEIFNGTANEQTVLNYYNSTIEPILTAITDEFKRKFLTQTARTQGQSIMFFRDPFKLAPINNIAEIADKFTRNEILTSNEIRGIIGFRPSSDPKADQLINSNLNQNNEEQKGEQPNVSEEVETK